jgi:hypothetical protein
MTTREPLIALLLLLMLLLLLLLLLLPPLQVVICRSSGQSSWAMDWTANCAIGCNENENSLLLLVAREFTARSDPRS